MVNELGKQLLLVISILSGADLVNDISRDLAWCYCLRTRLFRLGYSPNFFSIQSWGLRILRLHTLQICMNPPPTKKKRDVLGRIAFGGESPNLEVC